MNQLTIIGRLGGPPEQRTTPTGKSVCTFSVAVDGPKRDGPPLWVKVTAWDKLGDLCAKYLEKGRQVCVVGEVGLDSWADKKTGEKRASVTLNARQVEFIGSRSQDSSEGPSPGQNGASGGPVGGQGAPAGKTDGDGYFDEEVPF